MPQGTTDNLSGSAYGRVKPFHDAEITEVGPGTPCGEFMRRYWHPIEMSERLGERPIKLRILSEDLISSVIAQAGRDSLHPAAFIAVHRWPSPRSKRAAFDAPITDGFSIPRATVWNSHAKARINRPFARGVASPGIRLRRGTG